MSELSRQPITVAKRPNLFIFSLSAELWQGSGETTRPADTKDGATFGLVNQPDKHGSNHAYPVSAYTHHI